MKKSPMLALRNLISMFIFTLKATLILFWKINFQKIFVVIASFFPILGNQSKILQSS